MRCENFRTFTGQVKKNEVEQLKSNNGKQTSFVKNRKDENVANTIASYKVSKCIAEMMKSFSFYCKDCSLAVFNDGLV